jgi:hypothetical protein
VNRSQRRAHGTVWAIVLVAILVVTTAVLIVGEHLPLDVLGS